MTSLNGNRIRRVGRAGTAAFRISLVASALALVALLASPLPALAEEFDVALARVDEALRTNPSRTSSQALESCRSRRNFAVMLWDAGQLDRANRSLKFCYNVLEIEKMMRVRAMKVVKPPSMEELQARAAREIEEALSLTPNIANGLEIYRTCAMCHTPEGSGLKNGSVPQIAGQHTKVVIKQLADLRAGNRDSVLMLPYATVESIGGAQAIADVAGYIDTLEISVGTGTGTGEDLALGERLYVENCARCHGAMGEGDSDKFMPRLQAQHYSYLLRQFQWIREGKRRNADPEMVTQIESLDERETHAILDYVSRLEPAPELQAPANWQNPDFEGQRPWSRALE